MHWMNKPIGAAQAYYKKGRNIKTIHRSQIDGVCQCGYITLNEESGRFTVRRDRVRILDDETGEEVKILRPRAVGISSDGYRKIYDFNKYCHCNACVNDWR